MTSKSGYELWLSYAPYDKSSSDKYHDKIKSVYSSYGSEIMDAVSDEIEQVFSCLFDGYFFLEKSSIVKFHPYSLLIAPFDHLDEDICEMLSLDKVPTGDGFSILEIQNSILITGLTEKGVLYGCFHFIRLLQTGKSIDKISITTSPNVKFRILNHWDNLDGSIERGYAGKSIWKWSELPYTIDSRYKDYARACASIGINGAVLNNVNTQVYILSQEYIEKASAIASVLRHYGIRIFLSVNFSSPVLLGGLGTADPMDKSVIRWWKEKIACIYALIPDFGGFLVKADSEGQPGPYMYGRNHADGANMLGRVLAPYGGIVIWRAFVYGQGESDRAKKAYSDFKPLDGQFLSNVCIQVKNGPIDFQPREPVHPLFGAMKRTNVFMEFQITQEYLGQGNHLVFLAPMWKEILAFDTYSDGSGSDVGSCLSKINDKKLLTGISGVSNIGSDSNWCSTIFHQANWYAFGRLCWDYNLSVEEIAKEWAECTFGNNKKVLDAVLFILMNSWQACLDYMAPLGLHHIMRYHHHYGPDPGCDEGTREDWKPRYYHRADSIGLGFDRTRNGSAAVDQYDKHIADIFNDIHTCPEKYLLWFHHVPWDYVLSSGRNLKQELSFRFNKGVEEVQELCERWISIKSELDEKTYNDVLKKLEIQKKDAVEWRDVCLEYFMKFAGETKC
ncbi:MAG: alpha-glucuronidase [Treponemataceae bacterium]|nr:alpha-glucuronidase [Treponemataceae bacterium]